MVTSALAAYAFVFLDLRWRGLWFALFLSTMMIPYESIIIPNYLFISEPGSRTPSPGWPCRSSPPASARSCCGRASWRSRWSCATRRGSTARGTCGSCGSILLPLSRPTLAALGIYSALSAWNMYFWPLLITTRSQNQTVQIGIGQLQSSDADNPGMVLAGVVLALLPTLLLVVFGQRFIVRGLTAGAVK